MPAASSFPLFFGGHFYEKLLLFSECYFVRKQYRIYEVINNV